jgi:hypothetical protein
MSTQHSDGENPQMPHSVQPVQAAAATEAVRRARNQATVVTCVAATVPTVLAMQGMASLAVDLLHFAVVVAIALAGFLELALISFALLTRASALAGRPGGVDAAAVWGVSLASGTFSALHELVGPAIGNTRAWQVDPGSLLAACVRLTAPLVAALLWERVLTAARREHEARSLVQVRRDHRLIAVAQAALTVRQLSEDRPHGRRATARLRRARRRLQRAHVTALRMTGVGPDLFEVLAAVGAVDILPAATIPTGRSGTRPDTRGGQVPAVLALSDRADGGSDTLSGDPSGAVALSDTVSDTPAVLAGGVDAGSDTLGVQVPAVLALSDTVTGGADTGLDTLHGDPSGAVHLSDMSDVVTGGADTGLDTLHGDPSGAVHLSDMSDVVTGGADTGSDTLDGDLSSAVALSDMPAVLTGGAGSGTLEGDPSNSVHLSDTLSDTSAAVSDTSAGVVVVPDPLTIAVELVRNDRQVAGSRIAAAMRRHGHTVTDRTGLRWRDRAMNHLATELSRDLSDASNDEVQLAGAAV